MLYDSPTVTKIHLSRSISGSCQEVVRDRSILPKVCTPLEPDTNGAGTDNQHSTSAVVNQSVPESVRQAVSQAVCQSVTRLVHSRDQPATMDLTLSHPSSLAPLQFPHSSLPHARTHARTAGHAPFTFVQHNTTSPTSIPLFSPTAARLTFVPASAIVHLPSAPDSPQKARRSKQVFRLALSPPHPSLLIPSPPLPSPPSLPPVQPDLLNRA